MSAPDAQPGTGDSPPSPPPANEWWDKITLWCDILLAVLSLAGVICCVATGAGWALTLLFFGVGLLSVAGTLRRGRGWGAAALQVAGLLCMLGAVLGFSGLMWDKIEVVTYAMLLLLALWAFAATYKPFHIPAFGRPVSPRLAMAIRVTAALVAVLCLVALVWDIFFR
jgi:hypothetical protein